MACRLFGPLLFFFLAILIFFLSSSVIVCTYGESDRRKKEEKESVCVYTQPHTPIGLCGNDESLFSHRTAREEIMMRRSGKERP